MIGLEKFFLVERQRWLLRQYSPSLRLTPEKASSYYTSMLPTMKANEICVTFIYTQCYP